MKIYISGKITGLDEKVARALFEEAEKEVLSHEGWPALSHKEVINPFKVPTTVQNPQWNDFMAADIAELLKCDAIYMMTNWGDSRGARVEYAIAKELGLTIKYQPNGNRANREQS